MDHLHRRVAKPAFRHVDDALELQIVRGIVRHFEVRDRVLDFLTLIETRTTDDAIGQPERDEAVFEGAHLERRAHQDRDLVELVPPLGGPLDLLADRARLFLVVPYAQYGDPVTLGAIGEKGLAKTAGIVSDQLRRSAENVPSRAIVAFETDHGSARKILLEAQDVVDLGTTPAVDRLVVVADAAEVRRSLRDQTQPLVLDDVGILVFVDENVAKAPLVIGEHIRVFAEQPERLEQQVTEIDRVELLQSLLIGRIEPHAHAGEGVALIGAHFVRRQPLVLPIVDHRGELAARPAVLVEPLCLDHLLHQPELIVDVEDREAALETDQFGMPAQDLDADRVEGAEPRHSLNRTADERTDALLHFARRLVGEGDREDLGRIRLACREYMGDAGRQHARLADARAREDEHGPIGGFDGAPLLCAQARKIRGRNCR